jgi:hypothetical protein
VTSRPTARFAFALAAASSVAVVRFAAAQDGAPAPVAPAASASVSAAVSASGSVVVAGPEASAMPAAPAVSASASVAATIVVAAPSASATAPAPRAPEPATTPSTDGSNGVTVTLGNGSGDKRDDGVKKTEGEKEKEKPFNPFRGSTFLVDQSATVNSFLRDSQQSYQPLTETWLSARLSYSFDKHWKVGLRQDFFLEETDSEGTTNLRNQWHLGDMWLTGGYSDKASFINDNPGSRWSVGAIIRPPTSPESQANGAYLGTGLNAALNWAFDVNKKSKWFSEASISPTVSYSHNWTRCTTPCTDAVTSQGANSVGANGQAVVSDQLRSGTLAGDSLIYALNGDLTIYDKLSLSASMIFISQFAYAPTPYTFNGGSAYGTGPGYTVPTSPNDQTTRTISWFLVDANYDLMDEVSLSVGYYNMRSIVSPGGAYANPLGSPDSRFFFDVVVHLDALYMDAWGNRAARKVPAIATR